MAILVNEMTVEAAPAPGPAAPQAVQQPSPPESQRLAEALRAVARQLSRQARVRAH